MLARMTGTWLSEDEQRAWRTYLPLVRFRSPKPLSSWVIALLAVMDSAALYLALSPRSAPVVPARLCLRSGFECVTQVARAMDIDIPEVADPDARISLSYDEFLEAVAHMREVDFPIERDPADAWPDFVGWRVNYEQAAYAVASAVDAVPAMWSGPRRHPVAAIAPTRPPTGRPPGDPRQAAYQAPEPDPIIPAHLRPQKHQGDQGPPPAAHHRAPVTRALGGSPARIALSGLRCFLALQRCKAGIRPSERAPPSRPRRFPSVSAVPER